MITIVLQILGNVAGEYLASQSEDGQGSGTLPCAVGGLYATWLTFSALSSNPEISCNPFAGTNDATAMWVGVLSPQSRSDRRDTPSSCSRNDVARVEMLSGVGDAWCYEDEKKEIPLEDSPTSSMHAAAAGDVEASSSDEFESYFQNTSSSTWRAKEETENVERERNGCVPFDHVHMWFLHGYGVDNWAAAEG